MHTQLFLLGKSHCLEVPRNWADLTKPQYKGYIYVVNPNSSWTANTILTTILNICGREDKIIEYMKALDKNIDQYTKSGSAPGKSIATGEITVSIGYAHVPDKLKVAGFPTVFFSPVSQL